MSKNYPWAWIDELRERKCTWPEVIEITGLDVVPSTLRGANSRRTKSTGTDDIRKKTVTLSGTTSKRITCLEDLFELFDIPYTMVKDPKTGRETPHSDLFDVDKVEISSWEQHSVEKGFVTQYSVKCRLKPRENLQSLEAVRMAVQQMLEDVADHAPTYSPPQEVNFIGTTDDPVLYELAAFDPHLGMLAWGAEVGTDYDSKIAVDDYGDAIEYLLQFARHYLVDRVLYIVGNDFLHVDGPAFDARGGASRGGATTAGTQQDVDTRLSKMFTTGRRALVRGIDMACATVCPAKVDVLVVPGNHDEQQMYRMAEVLSAWYRNSEQVNVIYGPNKRKYYQYGKNLLGFTHGEEFKRKRDNLALIMPTECPPEMWASTTHREWHVGHNHIKREKLYMAPEDTIYETRGIRVRSLPGLTPEDAWHYKEGYKHRRTATALAFRKSGGPIGVHEFNLD